MSADLLKSFFGDDAIQTRKMSVNAELEGQREEASSVEQAVSALREAVLLEVQTKLESASLCEADLKKLRKIIASISSL